jgi:hypothetical protein
LKDDWLFVCRRGLLIRSQDDFASYLFANLLPKGQIHPTIAGKVYPAFLRGEYDTAVFQAFREVEVAVRQAIASPATAIGVALMRDAFRATQGNQRGALSDQQLPAAEQEAMANLSQVRSDYTRTRLATVTFRPAPATLMKLSCLRVSYCASSIA